MALTTGEVGVPVREGVYGDRVVAVEPGGVEFIPERQDHPIPLGYVPDHHPQVGDLSFFVGFAIAALVYLALNVRTLRAR